MSKKVKQVNENQMQFALSTDTLAIKKYPTNKEGEVINKDFNAKTYTKKAYAAYLKGKDYFTYKGQVYIVPKMPKKQYNELLDNISLEGEVTPKQIESEVINEEVKSVEQWL